MPTTMVRTGARSSTARNMPKVTYPVTAIVMFPRPVLNDPNPLEVNHVSSGNHLHVRHYEGSCHRSACGHDNTNQREGDWGEQLSGEQYLPT